MSKSQRKVYIETRECFPEIPPPDAICRICLDFASESSISPCKCIGTIRYVHKSCLETWILLSYDEMINSSPKCEICNFAYVFEVVYRLAFKCEKPTRSNFSKFYCIPVQCLVILILTVTLSLLFSRKFIDFRNNTGFSLCIVIGFSFPMIVLLCLIIRFMFKVLFVRKLSGVIIKSYN